MNKHRIRWIIALMSIALLGIITLQVYWIMHDIQLKEQQFEQTVTQAMSSIVDRIETNEAMNILHDRIFDIDPHDYGYEHRNSGYADESPTTDLGGP